MIKKLLHYYRRYKYKSSYNLLPDLPGGKGANGQDLFILKLLGHKRNGTFIDIGANDGITLSNTYLLEREYAWRGVAIEPIPKIYQKLKENRVCQTINGCIANQPGKAKFIEVEGGPNMLSTLAVNNVGLTARRIRKNAKRHNANVKEIEVECYDIKSVAEKSGIKSVDFLSLDTEGGELEILKSINFQKLPITLISVENNFYTPDIRIYLESQGFIYLGTFKVDEIYININPKN